MSIIIIEYLFMDRGKYSQVLAYVLQRILKLVQALWSVQFDIKTALFKLFCQSIYCQTNERKSNLSTLSLVVCCPCVWERLVFLYSIGFIRSLSPEKLLVLCSINLCIDSNMKPPAVLIAEMLVHLRLAQVSRCDWKVVRKITAQWPCSVHTAQIIQCRISI